MRKTVIAFGEGMLVSRAPDDFAAQFRLRESGLLFDGQGNKVTTNSANEALVRYCIPLRTIVRLMQAMGTLLFEKVERSIELVFLDKVFLPGHESVERSAIENCLQQAFEGSLPNGFAPEYWEGIAENASIANMIEHVKTTSQAEHIVFVTSDQSQIQEVGSCSAVSVVGGHGNLLALMKICAVNDPDTVYIDASSTANVNLMVDAMLRAVDSLFRVGAMLKPVDSPFVIYLAYMTLLRDRPNDFTQDYSGKYHIAHAHSFITNVRFSEKFEESFQRNHALLSDILRCMASILKDGDSIEKKQSSLEVILFHFTGFFRGKHQEGAMIIDLMPDEIINIFKVSLKIYGDNTIWPKLFLRWLVAQLSAAPVFKLASRWNSDLIQLMTGEKLSGGISSAGLMDRISLAMSELVKKLEVQIEELGSNSRDVNVVVQQLLARLNIKKNLPSAAVDVATNTENPPSASTVDVATNTENQYQFVIIEDSPSAAVDVATNTESQYQFLAENFVSSQVDLPGIDAPVMRVEQFIIQIPVGQAQEGAADVIVPMTENDYRVAKRGRIDAAIKDFLAQRLRLNSFPGRNILPIYKEHVYKEHVYKEHADSVVYVVVAIVYCGEDGMMTYYRRDNQGDAQRGFKKELKPHLPVNDSTILTVAVTSNDINSSREEITITIEYLANPSSLYLGEANSGIVQFPVDIPSAPVFHSNSVLKIIDGCIRRVILSGDTDKNKAMEILIAMQRLNLIDSEKSFLDIGANILSVAGASLEIIAQMQKLYEFMGARTSQGLHSYRVTSAGGVEAMITARGKKWLSLWNLLLSMGFGVALPIFIWNCQDSTIVINEGDAFDYLTPLNTLLMRGAALTVYIGTIALVTKELTNYLFELGAQYYFRAQLARLPKDILHAVINGSTRSDIFPMQLYQALLQLCGGEDCWPIAADSFKKNLGAFAHFCQESNDLPARLRFILMSLGDDMIKHMGAAQREVVSYEEAIAHRMHQEAITGLKAIGIITGSSVATVVALAVMYYQLIDTGEGEEALSPLTIASMYALGVAALYLLYKMVSVLSEAVVTLVTTRNVSFWGRAAEATLPLPIHPAPLPVNAVNSGEATPLLRTNPEGSENRRGRLSLCTIS